MKKILLLFALLICISFVFIGCTGTAADPVDGTDNGTVETEDNGNADGAVASDAELLESWDLSDGGTSGVVKSSIGKTDGTTRWGTWLRTKTFGFTLDFSTEGSYFKAENAQLEEMGDSFTVSTWLKAPPREDNTRVIISKGSYDENAPVEYSDRTVVHEGNVNEGWKRLNNRINDAEDESCEDGHCLEFTMKNQNDPAIYWLNYSNMDLSSYDTDDAYVKLRLYVEDASLITLSELEFSSRKICDQNEISWKISPEKDGWNEIYLPIKSATHTADGGCNLAAVNYTRFYIYSSTENTVRLDEVSFCRIEESEPDVDFALYLEGGSGKLGFTAPGLSGLENTDVALIDGSWHHVAVTLDNGSFTYYVDGEAVKTLSVTGSLTNNYSDIYAGAYPDASGGFDGSLAQLKIYSGAANVNETTNITEIVESDDTFDATAVELMKGIWVEPSNMQDLKNIKDMGFDHVRHGFDPDANGIVYVNEDGSLNEEAMETVEKWANNCVRAGLPLIIGPHPVVDWKVEWIKDAEKFELICKWYGELAAYIAERWTPQQVAITIMSEPAEGNPSKSWTWVSDRIYTAMRNAAPDHTLLMGGDAWGYIENMKAMSPVTDDNVKYSFSTYEPYIIGFGTGTSGLGGQVTFWNYLRNIPYPVPEGLTVGEIDDIIEDCTYLVPVNMKSEAKTYVRNYLKGISESNRPNLYGGVYNKDWHIARAESIKAWQDKYGGINVHVAECGTLEAPSMINYFGAVEGSGWARETYYNHLRDLITTFIDYGFGYDYCCYNQRDTTVFDAYTRRIVQGAAGLGLSSDEALSQYDYTKLEILQVTPVREYHPTEDLNNALVAIKLNDEDGAETATSELLLGITADYGKIKTVEDGVMGRAAKFTGAAGEGIISTNASLDMPEGMAVSAYINADNSASGQKQTVVAMAENIQKAEDGTVGKLMISDCETNAGWWGIGAVNSMESTQGGGDYAVITEAETTVIFCYIFDSVDMTGFMEAGYISMDVYCEDASKVTHLLFNFGSERGLEKNAEWSYYEKLSDGWNTVKIPVKAARLAGLDPSEVSYLRFVGFTPTSTTMALDNIYLELDPEAAKGYDYWNLSLDGEGYLSFESDKIEGEVRSDKAITDSEWHHVMVSYDGKTFTYYIDGEAAGGFEAEVSFTTPSTADLMLGSDGEGNNAYSGLLANLRIYDAAKTPDEIKPTEDK